MISVHHALLILVLLIKIYYVQLISATVAFNTFWHFQVSNSDKHHVLCVIHKSSSYLRL